MFMSDTKQRYVGFLPPAKRLFYAIREGNTEGKKLGMDILYNDDEYEILFFNGTDFDPYLYYWRKGKCFT